MHSPPRRRTHLRVALLATVLVVSALGATACASGQTSRTSVDVSGRIGSLRVDVSDRRAVVAFAGRPDAERRGRSPAASFGGLYDGLGYSCSRRAGRDTFALVARGGPACHTVFFIDARSGRLGTFYTIDPRYRARGGVRVGMPTEKAERLLHRDVHVACVAAIFMKSRRAALTVLFSGGVLHRDGTMSGGHVDALVLHGLRHDPGVFECM